MKSKPQIEPDASDENAKKQAIMPEKRLKLAELKQQVGVLATNNMEQSLRILKKWIREPEA